MVNRSGDITDILDTLKAKTAALNQPAKKTATKAASAVPRIASNSPAGKQITAAIASLRGLVDGGNTGNGQSKAARTQTGATAKPGTDQPRRTPTADQRSAMHAAAAAHTKEVLPGMVSRLEEEQARRRAAKELPRFAAGGRVTSRSTNKAKVGGLLPLPSRSTGRSGAAKASSNRAPARSTAKSSAKTNRSRGGSRRGR